MSDCDALVALSRFYGKQPDHVQGGGGNSSVKHSDGTITIKASGYHLAEVDNTKGFVTVARAPLVDFFVQKTSKTEAAYDNLIRSLIPEDAPRPSMECGFHAVLPGKFVLHTHSIWANLLTCSSEGLALLKKLDEDYMLIPYHTPGIPLSSYIATIANPSPVLLLQNHGMVIHADSKEALEEGYERIHKKIMQLLYGKDTVFYPTPVVEHQTSATDFPYPLKQENLFTENMDQILMPDQAVYFAMQAQYRINDNRLHYHTREDKALAIEQIALMISFILHEYQHRGWLPNYLAAEAIAELLNLGSEKYRQHSIN